ncbi:hypothetical protein [Microbacterium sp. A93]|uniref:hypothetical protein n=1 Tax=Microbacterium sp. A93 TaxID=3450716 RepID=UPI003F43CC48
MGNFRHRWHIAAGIVILSIALGGCTGESSTPTADSTTDPATESTTPALTGWNRGEDFPLDARGVAVAAWTGSEILVVGGETGPPCPPNADCLATGLMRDGAAFDPALGTWRKIADAPIDISPGASAAFTEGQLFIKVMNADEDALISYDLDADEWERWDIPEMPWGSLVPDGDRILFMTGSHESGVVADLVLDITTGVWSELPADPLGPAIERVLTPTPAGLVLTGRELVESPGSDDPSITLAALYDSGSGEWVRLPDTGQIFSWQWAWSGTRLVAPELGGADGGANGNWGRTYPFGGTITLPEGEWAPLAAAPEPLGDAWIYAALGGGRFTVGSGYVYDDELSHWTALERPSGAPLEAGFAIWADNSLIVLGGTDWTAMEGIRSVQTWVYTPPLVS